MFLCVFCLLFQVIVDSFELMQTVGSFVSCAHTFAGGTTAGRSRVLISHFKAQLSDRSVWCPYEVLSSLTVGQVFVLIVCVSSAGGFSCLWLVLCGLRGSPHTVCVIEQTQGGRYTITKWTQSYSWVPCTRFTLPITSKL